MIYDCLYSLIVKGRLRFAGYMILAALLWGCSSDSGNEPPVIEDPDDVTVIFTAGNSATTTASSRIAFPVNTPVKIYVYRRSGTSTQPNFLAAPYKVVEGVTAGTGTGASDLSTVTFTGGDITSDKKLTVRGGYKYDFIAVVNATPKATISDMGTLGAGVLTGFIHGTDLLAGCSIGTGVSGGSGTTEVKFTGYGADANGNLPHLGSAMRTTAKVTEEFLDFMLNTGDKFLNYGVSGMDFKQCLPKSANLPFGGTAMAYQVQGSGYTTSYSVNSPGTIVSMTEVTDVALSNDAVILPFPLRYSDKTYNTIDVDFRLSVNGGEVTFSAAGVQVPEFKQGYRYNFIVELDKDPDVVAGKVNLYLSIEPWSALTWESGMGEGDTENFGVFSLGSWSSVSWQSGMGAGSDNSLMITSVAGWSSVTWTSHIGND